MTPLTVLAIAVCSIPALCTIAIDWLAVTAPLIEVDRPVLHPLPEPANHLSPPTSEVPDA